MSSESEQLVVAAFHLMRSMGKPKKRIYTDEHMVDLREALDMAAKADLHDWERQWD